MKVDIFYEQDEEMISAHCMRDEIQCMIPDAIIRVINPDGEEEPKD